MKYRQVYDGEWVPITWNERLSCCECGLTHQMHYRIKNRGSRQLLEVKATVLPRSTAMRRRHMRKHKHQFPK